MTGTSDPCHEIGHDMYPSATSSGPSRLAGRRRHQTSPTSTGAATRYVQ